VNAVLDFVDLRPNPERGLPSCLAQPGTNLHAVQFYERDAFLCDTVAKFLSAGLAEGEHVYVVATKRHVNGFLKRIEASILQAARAEGRISIFDAATTLRRIMAGDMPDRRLFRAFLAEVTASNDGGPKRRVRAYGEMVDVLVKEGNARGAIKLEEFWHEALAETPFPLLCGYLITQFSRPGDGEKLMDVCVRHSQVIPSESYAELATPNARLCQVALLQQRDQVLKGEIEHRKNLERALSDALRDLGRVEGELIGWVKREQDARVRAEVSEDQKEKLLAILGHDLRNPLNTILTTVRMMTRGDEAGGPETRGRLERILASSVRMQRMLEQLLHTASSRLAREPLVERGDVCDLSSLVVELVGEVSAANPSRHLSTSTVPCRAHIDVERIQQVVWSLLNYVVAHTDSESEIRIEVRADNENAIVSIASDRAFVDRAQLTQFLDEPQFETESNHPDSDGLGLGLYLARRIISAHGGTIGCYASSQTGTKLEAILPLA
jgi:signal transduction histidine kinase